MRATNKISIAKTDNSSTGTSDISPAFIYLYDKEIDHNSIKFCTRIAKLSHLQAHVLDFDKAKNTIAEIHQRLRLNSKQSSHFLLHVHGNSTGSKGQRRHQFVAFSDERREFFTRKWLEKLLCQSPSITDSTSTALPFVHVLSCHSKVLAEEIKPDTPLWKSGWFILYSSSKITSANHFGISLEVMAGYLEQCESNEAQPDPLTLFYLAGLARGDCMTLLGGDLQQPLTLHAPKSQRDLEHAHSIKLCEGSALDKGRLLLAGIELSSEQSSLLPDPHDDYLISQLLATRIERGDVIAIKKIIRSNPKLLNYLQAVGTLPLASAVKNQAAEMILWMVSQGTNLNAADRDGDSVVFDAIALPDTVMLEFILTLGANPNCPNYQSITPLLVAIEHDRTEAAELLINYGADLSWKHEDDTALLLAVSKGQLSVVSCILQHSTDRNTGLSAQLVQQARTAGREDIALVLDQALESLPVWKH